MRLGYLDSRFDLRWTTNELEEVVNDAWEIESMVGTIENFGRFAWGNDDGYRFGSEWPGKRCGAQCKRTGEPCQAPAVKGSNRCRLHGGMSKGATTEEGKLRQRLAITKHGRYTNEARQRRAAANVERDALKKAKAWRRRKWTPRDRDAETGRFVRNYIKNPVSFTVIRPGQKGT